MDETLKLRLRVEDLLFEEADLLDQWKLGDWLALYTEDAHYHVPPSDVDGDTANPETSLFYIMDDAVRMRERVIRLSKIGAHSEHPKSKVRHLVTNVRASREGDLIRARSSFIVSRAKDITHDLFVGHHGRLSRRAGWRLCDRSGAKPERRDGDALEKPHVTLNLFQGPCLTAGASLGDASPAQNSRHGC